MTAAAAKSRQAGFTLIEIIVVLAIVGVTLSLVVMRLDHLSPKYALRAAAREVGAMIDLARGSAVGKGKRMAIRYELDRGTYQLFGPPPRGERGNGPWNLNAVGVPKTLPMGTRFRGLYAHAKGKGVQERGRLDVAFDPLSLEGSHIVYVENDFEGGKMMSVKYNALLGSCDYVDGQAEFETPPNN